MTKPGRNCLSLLAAAVAVFFAVMSLGGCEDKKPLDNTEVRTQTATLRAHPWALPELDFFDFSAGKVLVLNTDTSAAMGKDLFYICFEDDSLLLGEEAGGADLDNILLLGGYTDLNSIKVVPDSGYMSSVDVAAGDVFAIKTSEGHYAKILILDQDSAKLKFEWVYQPDGSRYFP
ncbi:MAG: hypothetical protein OEW00_13190 [candidate division Zixibacteria bacterium]|nr:hypothetical protein [candidate division Zixibacteria bacterium]